MDILWVLVWIVPWILAIFGALCLGSIYKEYSRPQVLGMLILAPVPMVGYIIMGLFVSLLLTEDEKAYKETKIKELLFK